MNDLRSRMRPTRAEVPITTVSDTFIDVAKQDRDALSNLGVRIPKELHQEIKQQALNRGVSVQDYVRAALVEAVGRSN